ncbi:E3 ubiquitin-protein ligase COP1 [Hibiscus syriacus]|uniref:E3 ubiquitin-protein ligase COP1 n=1 Tax=Hibiscus syriacus TaxID=106335 RepID=A0A6A2WT58_HIBSY|nr:E3 ubiquitin-protein ligase COP1-like [Hibiscus syriacus]KAE8664452.1 E3 ubiquitin-protein ligase COP1 [Hibiscus syriacus]
MCAIKSETPPPSESTAPSPPPLPWSYAVEEEPPEADIDKDVLCPICMQIIKDAFMAACGHSFCYTCITIHLRNKSDCPCCFRYLTNNHIFPNFLLNKLLKKISARQSARNASPVEHFRQTILQGCEVSAKELDSLLSLLVDKKRTMEQNEAETNMQILLDFLNCLRKKKLEELNQVKTDLQYIKEDTASVKKRIMELYMAKERRSMNIRMLIDDSLAAKTLPLSIDQHNNGTISGGCKSQGWLGSASPQRTVGLKDQTSSWGFRSKDANDGLDSSYDTNSGLAVARKRRIHAQFNDLQECYLQKRQRRTKQFNKQEDKGPNVMEIDGYNPGLVDFQSVLSSFTRYSRLRVIAELRHGDIFHSANIVSSIEFDRDDEMFAIAGVSRRIKVFELSSIVNEPADVHCPIVEMSTRSKLSCLSWNKYTKNHIASCDYDGIITVWDITNRQSLMEYEEHEKRAWSIDFCPAEPSMLVSGSDDCKVKVWCMKQEASVLGINLNANVCSVKYNPGSSVHVAVGTADHQIRYYDLRNTSKPLYEFGGHKKAVSYVKFLSNRELASASTDSTLCLWDVKENSLLRTFRGHKNERNFVGLTAYSDYIACGSETNEVFVYHKAISKPAARYSFGSDMADADEEAGSYFISAVCWKSDSQTMLAANSRGTIKVLVLAA